MSYTPNNWKSGDVVTSAKLNAMEQGIADASGGGGVLVVTNTDGTLDKTAGEIMTAAETGLVLVKAEPFADMKSFAVVVQADKTPMGYSFFLYDNTEFAASTESDYPQQSGD